MMNRQTGKKMTMQELEDLADEMGESDMDEFSFEEEGEDLDDDIEEGDEAAPQLVPLTGLKAKDQI